MPAASSRTLRPQLHIAGLIACLALAACGGPSGSPASSGVASASVPGTSPSPSGPELVFARRVEVAPGRKLPAECWGSGSPTIVLEAGGTRANISNWDREFVMDLAEFTTVCRYSRAGGESSTPIEGLLTYDMVIGDAFALLDWLRAEHGVEPPYVFVGASFGGFVALAEALERPDDTAGLVILDTDPPDDRDFMTICMQSGRTEDDCTAELEGDREAKELGDAITERIRPLPDLPAAIVSALVFPDCELAPGESTVAYNMNGADVTAEDCDALAERVADLHAEGWAPILPQLTQTRVQAGHDTLTTEARTEIVDVIRDVIERAAADD